MKKFLQIAGVISSILIIVGLLVWFLIPPILANNTGFEDKTLWDRMELLIIPLVLAIGAFFLNRSERNTEREIAKDHQREEALQAYLGRMADLLLKEHLRSTKREEVRDIARTLTLTVLRGLDNERKGLIINFLSESGLISKENPIISLQNSDIQGADLKFAPLADVSLHGANLRAAELEHALLVGADLTFTDLRNGKLGGAFLQRALLNNADLRYADLTDANLNDADLSYTDLRNAKVTIEQLAATRTIVGATKPDGTTEPQVTL